MSKKKKWTKSRHRVVRNIADVLMRPYMKAKYGIRIDPFEKQGDRQYLILFNHQTPFDQFFVGASFKGAVYYLASEDIFSNGLTSKLIRFLAAPIPIKKQTVDISAIKNCLKVAGEGGTLALAPEGNRTYNGTTVSIRRSITALARKLGLPVVLYRIEGGYGVQPRWSDKVRKGSMHSYVARVIEPEEYGKMTDDELYDTIAGGLYVDENRYTGLYLSSRRAEYLERAIYVCPFCGPAVLRSNKNTFKCCSCGREIEYGEDKALTGIGFDFPFKYVGEWFAYQCDCMRGLDLAAFTEKPLFNDTADVYEVILNKRKKLLRKKAPAALFGDRIEIGTPGTGDGASGEENVSIPKKGFVSLPFDRISAVTVLGRNKLNIYLNGRVYQLKGGKRFNALKYVNLAYLNKNNKQEGNGNSLAGKGEDYGKLLGL